MSNDGTRSALAPAAGLVLLGGAALAGYFVFFSDRGAEASGEADAGVESDEPGLASAGSRWDDDPGSRDPSSPSARGSAPDPQGGREASELGARSPSEPGARSPSELGARSPSELGAGSPGDPSAVAIDPVREGSSPLAPPGEPRAPTPSAGSRPIAALSTDARDVQAVRIGPTTPQMRLGRWQAMQRFVENRITTLNEELARHRQAGDQARAARAERLIRDLEAQRPVVAQHVEEARRGVEQAQLQPSEPTVP